MSNVRLRKKRGKNEYYLYCYDCKKRIENTANYEMRKEGIYCHGHFCKVHLGEGGR